MAYQYAREGADSGTGAAMRSTGVGSKSRGEAVRPTPRSRPRGSIGRAIAWYLRERGSYRATRGPAADHIGRATGRGREGVWEYGGTIKPVTVSATHPLLLTSP